MKKADKIIQPWKGLALLVSFALVFATAHAAESSSRTAGERPETTYPFTLREKPGVHSVGLKVVEQYDRSRSFRPPVDDLGKPWKGEIARPIQTLIWYPARASSTKRMTVGEYVALGKTEASFGEPRSWVGLEAWLGEGMGPSFDQPLLAARDAQPASGRFPVVIYAPSFSSGAWENADLCEFLASHGYVVIASPAMGVGRESTHDVAGTNAQARDISFLIGYAETLPNADASEVAAVGFSWGGMANLFAAARDTRIDALVSLDGSAQYYPRTVKQAGDVEPGSMTVPLLHFKGQSPIGGQGTFDGGVPDVLNSWTQGDLMIVQMLGLVHPHFSSMPQRNERVWQYEFDNLQQADYGREDASVGYTWVVRYTREFLDAYLKHDAQAMKFLRNSPAANGVPRHVMGVKFRNARRAPLSVASFKAELGRQGFEHASRIYASFQKTEPGFKLEAQELQPWGYSLLATGHFREAIEIMKLGTQIEPSGSAYWALGEAYRQTRQTQQALDSYKMALEKDPGNLVVRETLKEMEGNGTPSK